MKTRIGMVVLGTLLFAATAAAQGRGGYDAARVDPDGHYQVQAWFVRDRYHESDLTDLNYWLEMHPNCKPVGFQTGWFAEEAAAIVWVECFVTEE